MYNISEKTREEGRERQEREGRREERDRGKGEGAESSHHWDPSRLEAGRWALVQISAELGPCCYADCPTRSRAVPQGSRLRMTLACLGSRLVTTLVFLRARLVTKTVAPAPPSLLKHPTDLFTGDLHSFIYQLLHHYVITFSIFGGRSCSGYPLADTPPPYKLKELASSIVFINNSMVMHG